MSGCCAGFCQSAEDEFDGRRAARDLARYRRRGPDGTTRLLRDGVGRTVPAGATLLDVGCGVGALTFELLGAGLASAATVEASSASVSVGRDEAGRRELSDRIHWHHGDFVSLGPELECADVVTLDRVVCCYPSFEPLLDQAARLTRRTLALSYPRDRWAVRGTMSLENGVRRLKGSAFRTYVHAPKSMEILLRGRGLDLVERRSTFAWTADVYARPQLSH